ncbi:MULTISPECIES: pilus assembly protein TadG-related protein [Dietzia]|uniref:Pilus assembly protein TadG-related protein n=1 Tax=Dietzia maris TaxID=37915 RepID=A0AAE4R1S1_9ACTN|nr:MULTISPECIES: pilus assembly protein TadG-related protein [Dietzia]MDV6300698.1 pilus assembly protein TadG-related protein [Dietzia maris]
MLRIDDDRGAIAVLIAILLVPILGFAAISVDIAATHAERQQLQTGADAAALAIAQDCARKNCGAPTDTAQSLATLNSNSGDAVASLDSVPTESSGRVTVRTSAVRQHWFAPVLGVDSTELATSATAGWGSPTGGTSALPMIFSLCDFNRYSVDGRPSGREQVIVTTPAETCSGSADNSPTYLPGGFGWLETDVKKSCNATTRIGTRAESEPGNTAKHCDLSTIRDRTILVPIFDDADPDERGGQGRGAWYMVYGYAAFTVTGYHFSGQSWNPPCSGNKRCISGYFTTMLQEDPDFDYGPGGPDLGAAAVVLLPD